MSGFALSLTQSVTAAATLFARNQSLAAPTGTVQFFINGVASGTPITLSGSTATTAALVFPVSGTYTITATYSGDALYLPSTSSAGTVYVAALPPSLGLSASPSTLTFASGATVGNAATITVTGLNNFSGNATLNCTITSSSAADQPTCSVTPATVTLSQNGSATTTVTIATTTAHASLIHPAHPLRPRTVAEAGSGVFAVVLICGLRKRRRTLVYRSLAAIASVCVLTSGGCTSPTQSPLKSSAGNYTVTITASGTGIGALSAASSSTTLSVVVQ